MSPSAQVDTESPAPATLTSETGEDLPRVLVVTSKLYFWSSSGSFYLFLFKYKRPGPGPGAEYKPKSLILK